jgi:hypothetical protein
MDKFAVLIVKLCLPSKRINCESQGLLKHLLFTRFLNDLHAMRLTSMLISPSIPPLARAEGGFRSRDKSESALTLFFLAYTEATCIISAPSAFYLIRAFHRHSLISSSRCLFCGAFPFRHVAYIDH